MPRTLHLCYPTPGDLAAHLGQADEHQALMLSLPAGGETPQQFERIMLALHIGAQGSGEVEVEVLQMLGEAWLVLKVMDPGTAAALGRWAQPSAEPAPPTVSWEAPEGYGEDESVLMADPSEAVDPLDEVVEDDGPEEGSSDGDGESGRQREVDSEGRTVVRGHQLPRGLSPRSWPIEKIRVEWDNLSAPQKIQVARLGKKPVRRMIARLNEKKLTHFLLLNPQITVDEVASLANNPSLDPELVRRIANASEWTRHPSIARALICHPRLSMPLITRLVERLGSNELRRLARSGRLRAAVKRIVVKKLDRSRR